jgi:hypothetical protein
VGATSSGGARALCAPQRLHCGANRHRTAYNPQIKNNPSVLVPGDLFIGTEQIAPSKTSRLAITCDRHRIPTVCSGQTCRVAVKSSCSQWPRRMVVARTRRSHRAEWIFTPHSPNRTESAVPLPDLAALEVPWRRAKAIRQLCGPGIKLHSSSILRCDAAPRVLFKIEREFREQLIQAGAAGDARPLISVRGSSNSLKAAENRQAAVRQIVGVLREWKRSSVPRLCFSKCSSPPHKPFSRRTMQAHSWAIVILSDLAAARLWGQACHCFAHRAQSASKPAIHGITALKVRQNRSCVGRHIEPRDNSPRSRTSPHSRTEPPVSPRLHKQHFMRV